MQCEYQGRHETVYQPCPEGNAPATTGQAVGGSLLGLLVLFAIYKWIMS